MAAARGGILPDGATTYCWASNASTTAAQVDAASFGALGMGNGVTCPVSVSFNLNRTYAAGATPTISWAMLMLDPSASTSWAPFALNNITQNVTTSQLFYCPTDTNNGDETCLPFRSAAKPLSSPIFAQSFQQQYVSFSSTVEMPSAPGKYIVFASTTLPASQSTITANRLDIALFTSITITQTVHRDDDSPPSSVSHTALYVGLGVGAAVLVIGLVSWCWYTRTRLRQLEVELHRATFVANTLPRSFVHGRSVSGRHHPTPRSHLDAHGRPSSLPQHSFSFHHGVRMSEESSRRYLRSSAALDPSPRRLHIQDGAADYILNARLSSSEYLFAPQEHHHAEGSHTHHRRYLPRNSDHITRPTAFFSEEEDAVGNMPTYHPYWRQPTTPSDTSTEYTTQPQFVK
ncbi:hypothetical protein DYB32_006219 [Aphanomyces invadans]|uniref:Uncharacterized protein n=1 Tax=Aphanomyces invadans TaxID=157072 RepID=A0A418AYM4_9STRA|nr:hypothetical protein DYB32_006219 [Aphanomyces invadans]